MKSYPHIAINLATVRQRMDEAARRAGRNPSEIQLVAVSKTYPLDAIQAACEAGQQDFGENRLEELEEKQEANCKMQDANLQPAPLRWHMIGTIQSRKSKQMVEAWQRGVVLIHSVDTLKLASRLSRDAQGAACVLSVLLEVNVSGEENKHGFRPDELRQVFAEILALPNIQMEGLMTMAPLIEDEVAAAKEARATFRGLRQLQQELQAAYPQATFRHLSMGMTNDFEIAIEEGATIVRIGSAIFGTRR